MIDKELIDKLSVEMKEILKKELEAGNEIIETSQGRFTNDSAEHIRKSKYGISRSTIFGTH